MDHTPFLIALIIISAGFLLKKLNVLSRTDGEHLSKIILNVSLPALILVTLPKVEITSTLIYFPFICIAVSLAVLGITKLLSGSFQHEQKGLLYMSVTGFNIGLFAYPIVSQLFGAAGITYMAAFDVGNAFILFGLVYAIAEEWSPGRQAGTAKRENPVCRVFLTLITSVPLLSYIAGLILNVAGITLAGMGEEAAGTLANANTGMVLLTIGLILEPKLKRSHLPVLGRVLLFRYIPGIAIGLLLFFTLPWSRDHRLALLIAPILPIGFATIPYAVKYGYDEDLTGAITSTTMVISFLLLWGIFIIV